jgi:integrase
MRIKFELTWRRYCALNGAISWCLQERLGHSSIMMTMDVYGHLFPRGDDRAELAAAEKAFLGGALSQ